MDHPGWRVKIVLFLNFDTGFYSFSYVRFLNTLGRMVRLEDCAIE
jgi:hypothetical protein